MQLTYSDGDVPDAPADAEVINSRPGTPACHSVTLTSVGEITDAPMVSAVYALRDLHENGRPDNGA